MSACAVVAAAAALAAQGNCACSIEFLALMEFSKFLFIQMSRPSTQQLRFLSGLSAVQLTEAGRGDIVIRSSHFKKLAPQRIF